MLNVFIDTNIYEELNYNFDNRNNIFKSFIELSNNNEIKNIIISVVDNEVKAHLKLRIEENRRGLNKFCKWVKNELDSEIIEQNLNKELSDYEIFKKNSLSEVISVDSINPEVVLNKYFNKIPPFQNSKQNEFKDAFFIEGVLNYVKEKSIVQFVVITKDKGVIKAFSMVDDYYVIILNSIQELVDLIINYGDNRKKELLQYISSYNLKPLIEEKYSINCFEIEEESIDVEDLDIMDIYGLEILQNNEDKIWVSCDIGIVFKGCFSCLDYENSYYSSEEGAYLYKEYITREELMYICDVILEIKKRGNQYGEVLILDFPEIELHYSQMNGTEDIY